jgi:hypothetical protein
VVDLSSSSNEGDLIADVSQDEEFTKDFLATSTATSSCRLGTTKSSSSVTLMKKKRRYVGRKLLAPKMQLLLLQSTLP